MTDIKALLERYDEWNKERASYSRREEDDPVSPSRWEDSDDQGVELAHELASALQEKRTIWTCAMYGAEQPLVATVHETEDACVESLEETHGDQVERESDIVSDLETWGYHIHIDSHEI